MSQSQVWKKRSAGLTSELRGESMTWLRPRSNSRTKGAAVPTDLRKVCRKRGKI